MTQEQKLEQIRAEEKKAMQMPNLKGLWPYFANKIKNNPKQSIGVFLLLTGITCGGFAMGTFDASIAGAPNRASDTATTLMEVASIVMALFGIHLATKKQESK